MVKRFRVFPLPSNPRLQRFFSRASRCWLTALFACSSLSCQAATSSAAGESGDSSWPSDFGDAVELDAEFVGDDCTLSAAALTASDAARVTIGESTLFVGYAQVSGDNQDPVVVRVDGDSVAWCRRHENDPPDGRALGLTWDGGEFAYVVYTIVGGGTDLEKTGWFPSYGGHVGISGGGAKVSVLGRVQTADGALATATHVVAIKSDGAVNSHVPRAAPAVDSRGNVEFRGESAHKAIGADGRSPMGCTDYPFESRYRFAPDLMVLSCAECTNCSSNVLSCD